MEYSHFTAGTDDDGRRADRVLCKFLCGLPASLIYKSIRHGLIKINGRKTCADSRLSEGDDIAVAAHLLTGARPGAGPREKEAGGRRSGPGMPDILFSNSHIIAVSKPYDIPVHGCRGRDGLDSLIVRLYENEKRNGSSLSFRPGPLHRLDRKTTGVLLFSWSLAGARWGSSAFAGGSLSKYYLGIAEGHLSGKQLWEDLTEKRQTGNVPGNAFVTVSSSPGGKKTVTEAVPLGWGKMEDGTALTLVQYRILTGRTHQIRFQSASRGFPLWGDTAYGGTEIPRDGNSGLPAGRAMYLHSWVLLVPRDNPLELPGRICAVPDGEFMRAAGTYFSAGLLARITECDIIVGT